MLSAIERAGDRLVGSEGRVNPRSALNFFFFKVKLEDKIHHLLLMQF